MLFNKGLEVFLELDLFFSNSIVKWESVESVNPLKSYWYSVSDAVFNASDWSRLLRLIKQVFNHEFTLKAFLFLLKSQTQWWYSQRVSPSLPYQVVLLVECKSQVHTALPAAVVRGYISSKGLNVRLSSLSILGGKREKWTQFSRVHPNAEPFWIYVTISLHCTAKCHCGTLPV